MNYSLIATINRRFYVAYMNTFHHDTSTCLNASTLELAKYCWTNLCASSPNNSCSMRGAVKNPSLAPALCRSAAKFGNLLALQYLHSVHCEWDATTCSYAARYGHLHILEWARRQDCPWDEATGIFAAEQGHVHILQWVWENAGPWNHQLVIKATQNGHLAVVQWAQAHYFLCDKDAVRLLASDNEDLNTFLGPHPSPETPESMPSYNTQELPVIPHSEYTYPRTPSSSLSSAMVLDNFDVLKRIVAFIGPKQFLLVAGVNQTFHKAYHHNFSRDDRTVLNASTFGLAQFCLDDVIHQFHQNSFRSYECQIALCRSAARYGNLLALQYFRFVNCHWNPQTCSAAALHQHYNILEWAHDMGCDWDENTCHYLAKNGDLPMLQWARYRGCPWDDGTCAYAAEYGHLHVLQWLRNNDCPWDALTCAYAAQGGHLHVLQWARKNNCPWNIQTCSRAAEYGHLTVLRWAIQNGCKFNLHKHRDAAALNGQEHIVDWINNRLKAIWLGREPDPQVPESDALQTLQSSTCTFPVQVLESFDILKLIIAFLGPKRFVLVATINRHFHDAYLNTFPNDRTTYVNASTLQVTKYCMRDLIQETYPIHYQAALCRSAASHGNLQALQFLYNVKCEWDETTCANAAKIGHLYVV
jgi:hypothetical protein